MLIFEGESDFESQNFAIFNEVVHNLCFEAQLDQKILEGMYLTNRSMTSFYKHKE